MAEPTYAVRTLALATLVSLLVNTTGAWAQAAPPPAPQAPPAQAAPPQAPPAQAAPPPAPPQQAYPQQQVYPQQYQQPPVQQVPQGAPPPAGYAPSNSPLYPQQQPAVQPGYAQPAYPVQQRWRPPRETRPRRGLMIAGASVLGGFYAASTFVGAIAIDANNDDDYDNDNWRSAGAWLMAPVVGPFVAMSKVDDGSWALWWLGMGQVVGLGLLIGGIVLFNKSKRAIEADHYSHIKLPGNRELSFDVTGGPRTAGPRLQLTF